MSDPVSPALPDPGSVSAGVGLALSLHLLQFPIVIFGSLATFGGVRLLFPFVLAGWSLTQFLYLGPAAWLQFRRHHPLTAKGILITAAVGVLLNGACDALLFR